MSSTSLSEWLRASAGQDALLSAWHGTTDRPTTPVENEALAIAGLAMKARTPAAVAVPGGHGRLPLLTAVHQAALQLPGFPSPFTTPVRGPAALVTRRTIRRDELAVLDAADIPVWHALRPSRLRADGLVAPLYGGRAQPHDLSSALVFVGPAARWIPLAQRPAAVVIDGVCESAEFVDDALAWATTCQTPAILFVDAAHRDRPADTLLYPAGWTAILRAAAEPPGDPLAALAAVRGHAAVLTVGPRNDLAIAAQSLAGARRHGPLPPPLIEAAVLVRRLAELVVPMKTYDAACPRWRTSTLSERLEDVASVRTSYFPREWRLWAETGWAVVKEGLASAAAALRRDNQKMRILVEAVDADLRAGLDVDITLPSRVARDAVVRHLADTGVPHLVDGRLVVRSLADTATGSTPPRATVLAAPPIVRLSHRIVSADVGPLNVLCYDHEVTSLRRALYSSLDEPPMPVDLVKSLLPPKLDLVSDRPPIRPAVVLSISRSSPADESGSKSLSRFVDASDIAGLAALTTELDESAELPDDESISDSGTRAGDSGRRLTCTAAVPMTVSLLDSNSRFLVYVPADATVLRVLAGRISHIPALDVLPGMLLAGLDGVTPFDRVRPLLLEARGPTTRMLLTAWEQALAAAMHRSGGPGGLARSLGELGADITASAVEAWSGPDRIGPRQPTHVALVGQIAGHAIVRDHASAVSEVMRALRAVHQAVGRKLAEPNGFDNAAADLEQLLGPEAASAAAETVVYRLVNIRPAIDVERRHLLALRPVSSTDPATEDHP